MPNGTSYTFFVRRNDFALLIDAIESDRVVGRALFDGVADQVDYPVTAASLKGTLQSFRPDQGIAVHGDDVFVTEHDHVEYIVHMRPWVVIERDSPLFEGIERLREDWNMRLIKKIRDTEGDDA